MSLRPVAWTAWLAAAIAVGILVSNPLHLATALGAIVLVHLAAPPERGFMGFLALGGVLVVLRLVFVVVVPAPEGTALLTLPEVSVVGLELGGPVTAEVLAESATDGLRLLVALAAFGVFASRVDLARAARVVPGPLRDLGVAVSIAVAFVPGLIRTMGDIRDARRLRGDGRLRTLAPSMAVPVLGMTLERAMLLAESMDARGYGSLAAPLRRVPIAAGAASMLGGVTLWTAGLRGAGSTATLVGIAVLALAVRAAGRSSGTTRLAGLGVGTVDLVVILAAAAGVAAVSLSGSAGWSAYPRITAPPFTIASALGPLLLAAPAIAEVARR